MQCVLCKEQFKRTEVEHRHSSPFKTEIECPRCKKWLKKSPKTAACQTYGVLVWLLWLAAGLNVIQLSQTQFLLSLFVAITLFCFSVPLAKWQAKTEGPHN